MKKIISLFKRNWEGDRLAYDEVTSGAEWVVNGEGVATAKIDGTACLVRGGKLYKRYDAKHGKTPPVGWLKCEDAPNPITGHWPGWLPVGDGPEDRWHREAWAQSADNLDDWTYELIGPKVQGNPYNLRAHILVQHGRSIYLDAPRTFDALSEWLAYHVTEGIVWWRDPDNVDCDKVKIKRRDFGLPWPAEEDTCATSSESSQSPAL